MENFLVMVVVAITGSVLFGRCRICSLRVEKVIYPHGRSCISSRYQKRNILLTGME